MLEKEQEWVKNLIEGVLESVVKDKMWKVQFVDDPDSNEPSYAYSVGFAEIAGAPGEVVVSGFDYETSIKLINIFCRSILDRGNVDWVSGNPVFEIFTVPTIPVKINNEPNCSDFALGNRIAEILERDYETYFQLVMPDANGKFPLDEDVDPIYGKTQSRFVDKVKLKTN